jgi:hypothetical protein
MNENVYTYYAEEGSVTSGRRCEGIRTIERGKHDISGKI